MTRLSNRLRPLGQRAAQAGLALAVATVSTAALAVNSLPGGPAVNQIDLHPPVTKIAADQQWLHNFMLVICLVIFVAVFGVMFYSVLSTARAWVPRRRTSTKAWQSRSPGPWCRS